MNTQKSGGNDWSGAKFVKRVEMSVMQYVILGKASESQGGATRENLQQVFRGNMQMSGDHFEHCLSQLVSEGHLKQEGNKYLPTDDGREDVQKLQTLMLEIPNVVQGVGNKQGMTAQKTTGGQGSSMGGGNVGNSNESIVGGNTGNIQNKGGNVGGAQQNKGANQGNAGGFKGATGGETSQGVGSGGKSGMSGTGGSGGTGQTLGNQGNFGRSNSGQADTGSEWKQGSVNKGGATRPSVEDNVGDKGDKR